MPTWAAAFVRESAKAVRRPLRRRPSPPATRRRRSRAGVVPADPPFPAAPPRGYSRPMRRLPAPLRILRVLLFLVTGLSLLFIARELTMRPGGLRGDSKSLIVSVLAG